MALVKNNDLTEGMSGRIGNKIVFRVIKRRTVAPRRPLQPNTITVRQQAHRERFQRAALYAKTKMLDPVAKAEYQAMADDHAFNSAFAAAVRDYLVAPKILSVDVSNFTGAAGSALPIKVSDNFKVTKVKVSIVNAGGVIESGDATYTQGDVEWKYTTKQALPSLQGVKISVTATDRPGNEASLEKALS